MQVTDEQLARMVAMDIAVVIHLDTAVADWLRASLRRDPVAAFDHEVWLWFFAGIFRQRLKDRSTRPHAGVAGRQHV